MYQHRCAAIIGVNMNNFKLSEEFKECLRNHFVSKISRSFIQIVELNHHNSKPTEQIITSCQYCFVFASLNIHLQEKITYFWKFLTMNPFGKRFELFVISRTNKQLVKLYIFVFGR